MAGYPVSSSPTGASAEPCSPALSTSSEESAASASSLDAGVSAVGRKRMRAFLEDLLESKEVPGLEWCDEEKKVFRMPWKHAKKTDYDPEKDGKLFKLWAINTGKYKDGDKVEPTAWKINFRCALNGLRETICEVDIPLDDDVRVFRFVDQPAYDNGGAAVQNRPFPSYPQGSFRPAKRPKLQVPWIRQEFEQSPGASAQDYSHPHAKMQYLGDPRFGVHVAGYPSTSTADIMNLAGSYSTVPGDSPGHQEALSDVASPPMSQGNTSHVSEIVEMTSRDFEQFDTNDGLAPIRDQAAVANTHPSMSSSRPLVSTEMFVKVAYRSSPIAGMRVTHPQGCRIFYGTPPPQGMPIQMQEGLFGPRTLMQLSLPHPNDAQALLPAMWEVLGAMHRGLVIEMHNNDIFVTRLCRAAVYWGPPGHDGIISKLERFKRTRIFSYNSFLQTYESYQLSERSNIACFPPSYEVVLGIAQPWGQDRLRDNNLLTITLIHSLAEKLIESLHCLRWKQNKPFDSDYLDIDSKTPDDELATNATKHMITAGRQPTAAQTNSDAVNGRSMQHPALAAMNKQSPRQQTKSSKAQQQRVQQLPDQQQVAAAMLQTSMMNAAAASGHFADIQPV